MNENTDKAPQHVHKVYVVFDMAGSNLVKETGNWLNVIGSEEHYCKIIEFKTESECDAYVLGLADAAAWSGTHWEVNPKIDDDDKEIME